MSHWLHTSQAEDRLELEVRVHVTGAVERFYCDYRFPQGGVGFSLAPNPSVECPAERLEKAQDLIVFPIP
jgi:hypothetical protein